jgi:hypothetical protein
MRCLDGKESGLSSGAFPLSWSESRNYIFVLDKLRERTEWHSPAPVLIKFSYANVSIINRTMIKTCEIIIHLVQNQNLSNAMVVLTLLYYTDCTSDQILSTKPRYNHDKGQRTTTVQPRKP